MVDMPARQVTPEEIEQLMVSMGAERYLRSSSRAIATGQESSTIPGRTLLSRAVEHMQAMVHVWMGWARTGRVKKGASIPPAQKYGAVYAQVTSVSPEVLAFITTQVVIDTISQQVKYIALAKKLGDAVEQEARLSFIKTQLPQYWGAVQRAIKDVANQRKPRALIKCMKKAPIHWERWSSESRVQIGMLLIELFMDSTGLIEQVLLPHVSMGRARGRNMAYIRPTDETQKWLSEEHEAHSARFPLYLPTTAPPVDWGDGDTGGYPVNIFMRWPLVKQTQSETYMTPTPEQMPAVYSGVNHIQSVGWRVNENVWAVFDHFWKGGSTVGDLPSREILLIPACPENPSEDALKRWRKMAAVLHSENDERKAKVRTTAKTHYVARHFADQVFYFPAKLDYRGRLYPIPVGLTPQGTAVEKGLLEFAEGKPLDSNSAVRWFLIHGANSYGITKATFTKRVAWIYANHHMILRCSDDPISNTEWSHADSPWQFLAFCFEYAEWYREPKGFMSHLPVMLDGSTNGLQLYSLLLRDPAGCAATNVTGREDVAPRDVYADVAAAVTRVLRNSADPRAEQILALYPEGLPRKLAKRNVMTLVYGSTPHSCGDYLFNTLKDRRIELGVPVAEAAVDLLPVAVFLAHILIAEVRGTFPGAVVAMDWLREVAVICTLAQTPVQWTTGLGFRVHQSNRLGVSRTVKLKIGRKIVKRVDRRFVGKLAMKRQRNGLPPNLIHSLDGEIMQRVAAKCGLAGIALSAVHDSFGTHASDTAALADILRSSVIETFSRDVLAEFAAEVGKTLPAGTTLPPIPPIGSLNLLEVTTSAYMYS